jgi:hypothetical protein
MGGRSITWVFSLGCLVDRRSLSLVLSLSLSLLLFSPGLSFLKRGVCGDQTCCERRGRGELAGVSGLPSLPAPPVHHHHHCPVS